jgi:uncharacterized membrane-anchored protein YitT (DUF2179 family)
MRKSSRIFLLTAIIVVLLAIGGAYLLWALNEAEAKRRVLTVFGGAIGGVGGSLLFLAVFLRFKDQ